MGLTTGEKRALHKCMTWLRQPGASSLCFYGDELENFDAACKKLMERAKHVNPKAQRVRASERPIAFPEH